MKKIILLLILAWAIMPSSTAQTPVFWEKPTAWFSSVLCKLPNQEYVLSYYNADTNLVLVKVDKNGQTLCEKEIAKDTYFWGERVFFAGTNCILLPQDSCILLSYIARSLHGFDRLIYGVKKISYNLEEIADYQRPLISSDYDIETRFMEMLPVFDSLLFVSYRYAIYYPNDSIHFVQYVEKYNLQMERLDSIGIDTWMDANLVFTENDSCLHFFENGLGQLLGETITYHNRYNLNLNLRSSTRVPRHYLIRYGELIKMHTNRFVFCVEDWSREYLEIIGYNVKKDTLDGIWRVPAQKSIKRILRGRNSSLAHSGKYIFVLGTDDYPYTISTPAPAWLKIALLDTAYLLKKKQFYIGDNEHIYVADGIIATDDGGVLVLAHYCDVGNYYVGARYGGPFTLAAFKINANGEINATRGNPAVPSSECILAPNPSSGVCKALLAVQHAQAELFLYDMNGRLVLTKQLHQAETEITETTLLQSGTYVYKVLAKGKPIGKGKWVRL